MESRPVDAFFNIFPEELTPSEANVLISCRTKPALYFVAGLLAGYTAVYAATLRFPYLFRATLSTGVGISFGTWMGNKSIDSCLDQMLALNGSMLQKKVANIMPTQSSNYPISLRFLSKHFYAERVLDDSASDTPKLRWRHRNIFSDNVVHCHRTLVLDDFYDRSQDGCHYDSYDKFQGNFHNDSYNESQCESEVLTDSKRTTLETKQNLIIPGPDTSELDPFDCLFGYGALVEEIDRPNTSKKPQGTHNQGHRRYRRRRRLQNHNEISN